MAHLARVDGFAHSKITCVVWSHYVRFLTPYGMFEILFYFDFTRYNWSSYYAMAVIELGRAVAEKAGAHAR